jgi:hypothetical protein
MEQPAKTASAAASWIPNIISHYPSTKYVTIVGAEGDGDPALVPLTEFLAAATFCIVIGVRATSRP